MDKLTIHEILTARTDKCLFCGRIMLLMGRICVGCKDDLEEPIEEGVV